MRSTLLTDRDFQRFFKLVRQKSGILLNETRRGELAQAVQEAMDETGSDDPVLLYHFFTHPNGAAALERFVARLTIGESYFFRNRAQFQALEHHILPELIARRRAARRLRLWSASCSTGEEPYSLAIVLQRLLPAPHAWDIHLLASDLNPTALDHARRGLYSGWSFRGVTSEVKETYFTPHKEQYELLPSLRQMVTFRTLNLIEARYPAAATGTQGMDLILCRNTLLYMDEETRAAIIARFYEALAPGGWLIVGHTEVSLSLFQRFVTCTFPGTVLYQKPASATAPPPPRPTVRHAAAPDRQHTTPPAPLDEPTASPYDQAKALADQQRWVEALKRVEEALRQEPLRAEAHYLRGLILLEQGNADEALAAQRRALFVDPSFLMAHLALATAQAQVGQVERAIKSLEQLARLLAQRGAEEAVASGDGMTVGRLREMVAHHATALREQSSEP